jgi:hydroxyacylglutathione hydrolase
VHLEDHLGDVLRKAREAGGISVEAATARAGLPLAEYRALETSGRWPGVPGLAALARSLGLDPQKLEGIAQGWRPTEKDLGLWREWRILTTSRDGQAVHCYLVWDEVTREAALFDTGWEAGPVFDLIKENGLDLKHLFLTHTHEDHMFALSPLRERFPKLRLHTQSKSAPPQHRNRANDFIHLGSLRVSNRETPGHAEDGVIYVIGNWPEDAPHMAMVGDTLFAGSMATGFQSPQLLRDKIREQILSLPAETLLCPGHGPVTTVAEESAHNPFF